MIEPLIDIGASLARVGGQYAQPEMMKISEDLARYRAVIEADVPGLVIECGTKNGGSAAWFAALGPDVVTIDIAPQHWAEDPTGRVTWLAGDSADPAVAAAVAALAAGRRVMAVLDSDHSAAHVAAEIGLYGPLVTPGCHLVVEDGIARWMPGYEGDGSPLDAIEDLLADNPEWERDAVTEGMFPVSMFPAGWWVRRA
jgi:cephalosporin hydroxylase